MKSLKTIIIAGIVLVVFIIASVILVNLPQRASTSEDSAETSASPSASQTTYVVNRDNNTLVRFTIVPTQRQVDEDTAYAYASEELDVEIIRETDEKNNTTYSYNASPDPGAFEYDTSKFRSMIYTLTSISALNVVEEDAKDLSIYGLDQPTVTVKTYYSDGTELDLIVGSMAPVDENYYCMTNESSTVYTIGSYVDSLLVRRPIEYRDITLFPAYTEDDIYTNINWVRLTERDGSCIEVQLDPDQSNEYNTEGSRYVMLQPYQVSGNDTTIQTYILDVVSTVTLGSIIDDITEEEYADYGLNNPAKLEMTDIAGNSLSLLIGKRCPNESYTYCMLEGTNTLITCNTAAFDWMGLSYVQLMLRTIWTFNIEGLQSVDIDIAGEQHQLLVEHYIKQNANGNDVDGVTGTLDGMEISEVNVRRIFVRCLYFRIIDNLTAEEQAEFSDAPAYGTITLHMDDGDHVLEIVQITDRKYGLRLDGVMEYYCNKKSVTTLTKGIEYVLAGDELPMSFD